ncbi:hypothetical protein A9507_04850 [Methanobacterium sp. A39]|uniref:Uncharacterized protein n=2 Tax=Methanobacteriaceae TaxID=2159 RepID=A0A2A2H4U1_METBR|nr:hypothetical protein A9507_04850 [Methanobacterium sp. A39]PAV04439.1 hypothetical protein ASJ80_06265 [Methanobacterium bryantii]
MLVNKLFIFNNIKLYFMKNDDTNQEEKYLQTKESIINNIHDQKETEKKYLKTVNSLLDYWIKELRAVDTQNKKRHNQLLKVIHRERSNIKKMEEDINKTDIMIDRTEQSLERIRQMINSFRKER